MDEFTFRGTGGSGGSVDYQMFRQTPDGKLQLYDVDFNDYVHPPKGARGKFRLHGWSPIYETTGIYDGQEKITKRSRAEYLIVKLPGNSDLEGRLFSQQFPIPKNIDHEKAKLGQFIAALLNRPIVKDEPINIRDFIGTEFVTSVTRDEDGDRIYCGIAWDVIDPTKTKLAAAVNGTAPQPALVGAADEGDVSFDDEEEDL